MASKNQAQSTEISTFMSNLKALNMKQVVRKLRNDGWGSGQIQQAIKRYKLFLLLLFLYPTRALVPTLEIDAVVHAHLDTHQHRIDFQILFQGSIEHDPSLGYGSEADRQRLHKMFHETQHLFQFHFGIPIAEVDSPANTDGTLANLASGCCLRQKSVCRQPFSATQTSLMLDSTLLS